MDNRSMLRILGAVAMGVLGAWTPIIILALVTWVFPQSVEPASLEGVFYLYGCFSLPFSALGAGLGLAGAAIANKFGTPERAILYGYFGGMLTNGILAAVTGILILRGTSQGY